MTTLALLALARRFRHVLAAFARNIRMEVGDPIEVLNRMNWSAPWAEGERTVDCKD